MPSTTRISARQEEEFFNNTSNQLFRNLVTQYKRLANYKNKIYFYNKCLKEGLTPKYIKNMFNYRAVNTENYNFRNRERLSRHIEIFSNKIIKTDLKSTYNIIRNINGKICQLWKHLNRQIDGIEFRYINDNLEYIYNCEYNSIRFQLNKKLRTLREQQIKSYMNNENRFSSYVENLTNVEIPKNVIRGLSLGPKFGFIENKEKKILEVLADVEVNIRRIKDYNGQKRCRNKISNSILNFINKNKNIHLGNKKMDSIIASDIIAAKKYKKQHADSIIILNSDKSGTVVVMDRLQYREKVERVLQDTEKYKPVEGDRDPIPKIEKEINKKLKYLLEMNFITKDEYKKLESKNTNAGKLYFLVKSHKVDFPLRAVITGYDTPNQHITKFLAELLKPLVNNKFRVKNSAQCISQFKDLRLSQGDILCSFDIFNLFPSLPINIIRGYIVEKLMERGPISNLGLEQLLSIFDLCMETNIFEFEGRHYKQVSGCPIGGSISPVIADLFVDYVHWKVVSKYNLKLLMYYVDDSICVVNERLVDNILQELNSVHKNIRYTCERENNKMITFLDIKLIRRDDGGVMTDLYTKPQKSNRSINYWSYHPKYQKVNIIRNEISRISTISDPKFVKQNIERLKIKYCENDYPPLFVEEVINKQINKGRVEHKEIKPTMYGSIPYLPGLSEEIRAILNRFNISITFKINKPLTSITNNKSLVDKFHGNGVVYAVPCESCRSVEQTTIYVGETQRALKIRLKEHFASVIKSLPKSALSIHAIEQGHSFNFEDVQVLKKEKHLSKRRFYESFFVNIYNTEAVNLRTESERSALIYAEIIDKIKKYYRNVKMFG